MRKFNCLFVLSAALTLLSAAPAGAQYHPNLQRPTVPLGPNGSCPAGYTRVVITNNMGGAQTVCMALP